MPKCTHCGKEVLLPFVCPYCGKTFCAEHRLPENHQCPNLPKEPFGYQQKKIKEEKPMKEGELYFVKEYPSPEELKQAVEQKIHEPKEKYVRMLLAFCMILIVVSLTVAYAGYNFGYNAGFGITDDTSYNLGYNKGYPLGYDDGNLSGYEVGYDNGYVAGVTDGAGRGYKIRDPTYQEALQFTDSDQTDKNQYNEETYTCANFAADFKNNAFEGGYRCGYVVIEFPETAHAIVCFNTTNRGLVFIEPQFDSAITLSIGQSYSDLNGYELSISDDTIARFIIIW